MEDGKDKRFGEWLRKKRLERKFDIRGLANLSRVDHSTISRIENQNTQPTLYTAYRLCKGLEVPLSNLYYDLTSTRMSLRDREDIDDSILKIEDIEKLLDAYRLNRHDLYQYLADTLNGIAALMRGKLISPNFTVENMRALYARIPQSPFNFDLEYVSHASNAILYDLALHNYRGKGVLLLEDIGAYVRGLRASVLGTTLEDVKNDTTISASVLSRLEDGALEKIKLSDVLNLDIFFKQFGRLMDMFWDLCEFEEWKEQNYISQVPIYRSVIDREYPTNLPKNKGRQKENKLIRTYVRSSRWYQCFKSSNSAWKKYQFFYLED